MLKTLESIRNCTLSAKDGEIGKVRNVFFDDEHWTVRYLVVNTTGWLFGRDVLIMPRSVGSMDHIQHTIHVDLTRQQIKDSPAVDTARPLTLNQELQYHQYFGWPIYWSGLGAEIPASPIPAIPEPQFPRQEDVGNSERESNLRSALDLEGYGIEALDGELGHVKELLISPDSWRIPYLVLATRNWWPGKTVVVPTHVFHNVDWVGRCLSVALTRDEIREAPAYDPERLQNVAFIDELRDYFAIHAHSHR
ncbi:MAG: PRC-barrel domain-containing protein [Nibricoccus sp.]